MLYTTDVEGMVRYLIGNNTGDYSRDNILSNLKTKCKLVSKSEKSGAYRYNSEEVWQEYFMKNQKLKDIIEKRNIKDIYELIQYAENDYIDRK
jgi:hypothetical protein